MVKGPIIKSARQTLSASQKRRIQSSIRIFGVYVRQRVAVNVSIGSTVGQVKDKLQVRSMLYSLTV